MLISTNVIGTPRPIIKYDKLISSVKRQILKSKLQCDDVQFYTSPAISFLTKMLTDINDETVLTGDMTEVYERIIAPRVPYVSRFFDTTESGVTAKKDMFVKGTATEIFIPTKGLVGVSATVTDNWEIWKKVAPIKLVATDSDELATEWYHQIFFKHDKPTYVVFAIDTAALLLKYFIYLREFGYRLDNTIIHKFINEHIIINFYDDLLQAWVSKFLFGIVSKRPIEKWLSKDVFGDSEFVQATDCVEELYGRYIKGNLRFGDILNTKFYDGKTILDMVRVYDQLYTVAESRRHTGYSLLKLADITNILIYSVADTKDRKLETTIIRRLKLSVQILEREHWQTHVRIPAITSKVEEILENAKLAI